MAPSVIFQGYAKVESKRIARPHSASIAIIKGVFEMF